MAFFKKTATAVKAITFASAITLGSLASAQAAPENYGLDKSHTSILWFIDHLGFSTFQGEFLKYDGSFVFDQENPSNSSVDVTIEIDGVDTDVPDLDKHLKSKDFFDAAKFPTATYKSTKVTSTGKNTAKVEGNLTLHGVTKPVTLDVTLNKAAKHPFFDAYVAGFKATATIKRSEFGIKTYLPAVGDDVQLVIHTEGHKK